MAPLRYKAFASSKGGAGGGGNDEQQGGEEEDDYMKMTFEDASPAKETSLQRTERRKREARDRGFVKSKAQQEHEAAAARDKALSTSLLASPRAAESKGLAMMAKMGFTGGGLGGGGTGRTEPVWVGVKASCGGIGLGAERKRPAGTGDTGTGDARVDPGPGFRERVAREREEARLERVLAAAQRVAQTLDKERARGGEEDGRGAAAEDPALDASSRPVKSMPVVYRGPVRRARERADQQRRLKELASSQHSDDEREADEDTHVAYEVLLDDDELAAFDALVVAERLARAVAYMRREHRYCFWCKMAYPDDRLDGCPGLTEEDHD